jgi:hypothetical protein
MSTIGIAGHYGIDALNIPDFIVDSLHYIWRGNSLGYTPVQVSDNEYKDEPNAFHRRGR